MNKKFKLYTKPILTALCSAGFTITLTSCGNNVATQENNEINNQPLTETQNDSVENDVLTEQMQKDSAAEAAISIMIDGANNLKESASESANSEAVQEELARALQNFKDLSDFIFNGSEINGVTFSELSDEGKQAALNALNTLDDTLNYLIPDYKERFKDWLTDTAADGLDALSELRDEGRAWWDEIQSRRNSR